MSLPGFAPDKARLMANFNGAAANYDAIAVLQKTVAERLLEHLDPITIKPDRILDLGSGTGCAARALRKRYRGTRVVQLDIAAGMLHRARAGATRFFSGQSYICADAEQLPFGPATFDLIFSSLMLQWCPDPDNQFSGLRQCLAPGGLLLFSTLGPDTLVELKESWAVADDNIHVNAFVDMHDLGDALIRAGFVDPVLEVERLTLTYADVYGLMRELKNLGAGNVNAARRHTLTGKKRLRDMVAAYEKRRTGGKLPATYEVIYGHAWVPERAVSIQVDAHTAVVPVAKIGKKHD